MEFQDECKDIIQEKYLKVKDLLKTRDPKDDLHKSDFAAKELLNEMRDILQKKFSTESMSMARENSKLAGVYYLLGTVSMATEEITSAEEFLLKCYSMLEDDTCHPDNVLCITACLNQIGLLYARSSKNEDALNYLEKTVQIFNNYTANSSNEEPVSFITLYTGMPPKTDKNGNITLGKTYTLTLYYLAQVHTALEDKEKGAMYCHETLKRQIESNDYEHIDWAVNAATMSQVLIEKNAFKEARHHLAAAMLVLDQYQKSLDGDDSIKETENLDALQEELNRRRSDAFRCWIKYCIVLLTFSKDRLMTDDDIPECEPPPKELTGLSFPTLNDSIDENVVACDPILTFHDARPVFLFGQQCVKEATNYYTLTEHASDYTNISMDHSELYASLAFFEEDENRQCKMLKRRLDILTNVVKNLNPTYYLDVCRQLWISLGQICTDMIEIKMKKIKESVEKNPHQVIKVNTLIEDGVNYYSLFINSFVDKRTNRMPLNYPNDHEQSIILANLYAARLYSKFMQPDPKKSMEIDKIILQYYKVIVDYARIHKDVAQQMASEVQIASDMLVLIPYKLTRMAQNNV